MAANSPQFRILASRIEAAVRNIGLDLRGQRVLTEAASGPYIATAILAAVAGAAHVTACTRDSRWGSAAEISRMMVELADHFGVADRIEVSTRSAVDMAEGADVVTNLGFVRPISRALIGQLPGHAAIALMWAPWEFRDEDIDLAACREYGIPIIATNEHHPHLATFKAVGMLALKLLLERHCEVTGLEVLVVGSDPFGQACFDVLKAVGARVTLLNPQSGWPSDAAISAFERADGVVVVEHRHQGELLGHSTPSLVESIACRGIPLVHICGAVDSDYLGAHGIQKHPAQSVSHGFMTVTTAYLGVKPVVDLHAAGLHVASIVARERQRGANVESSIVAAGATGYGLRLLDADKQIFRS
jgi:hypothetical protein